MGVVLHAFDTLSKSLWAQLAEQICRDLKELLELASTENKAAFDAGAQLDDDVKNSCRDHRETADFLGSSCTNAGITLVFDDTLTLFILI